MKEIDFSKLKDPFDARDIEWRLQSCGEKNGKVWGICLAYVTNRAIQNRLDDVCGPENWKNEFKEGPDGGILCGISIKCGDEWVTKWDGAENTAIEAVKGGLSNSMKRAASTGWGIGRYLYYLDEGFAKVSENGKLSGKTKEGKWFKWDPPSLPAWALPKNTKMSDVTPASTPVTPDSPELIKASETVNNYIKNNQIDKSFIPKAQMYLANKDLEGLNKVIAYVEACIAKEVEKEISA